MITRPLDLASRLRREPRSYDWLFLVNGGLIVLFFGLFGSHFVLAPGLSVDFQLPQVPGATAGARFGVTHRLDVTGEGQIFTVEGVRKVADLAEWFEREAKTVPQPVLLLRASGEVRTQLVFEIANLAKAAGFEVQTAGDGQTTTRSGERSRK
jgi:biopolymer transport protein ExbD